jgi:hypothetical protein
MRHYYLLLVLMFAPTWLTGQPVHLAPVPVATFSESEVLLRIALPSPAGRTDLFKSPLVGLRVEDGRMYLMTMVTTEIIDMRELTIAQVVEQLRGKYDGIQVFAPQPGLKASQLREGTVEPVANMLTIGGRRPRPTVTPELGIGLSLAETTGQESGALLQNIGLHLDLLGTKQFAWGTIRARIGLSNAPQTTPKDSTGPDTPDQAEDEDSEPTSVSAFVESTQVVILGAQLDVPLWSFGGVEGAHLGWGFEWSNHYAAFEPFAYDSIPADSGQRRSVDQVFSTGEINRSSRILNRVRPVASLLTGPKLVFGTREDYSFYIQAETGYTEVYQRTAGVRYRMDPETRTRTPFQLLPRVGSSSIWVARVGIGVKLGSSVNIRADAVTAVRDQTDRVPPLLRLVVATTGLKFD